jgi:hypothetical protein
LRFFRKVLKSSLGEGRRSPGSRLFQMVKGDS